MQQIIQTLLLPQRTKSDIIKLEEFFYYSYGFIRQLRGKLESEFYMKLFNEIKYEQFPTNTTIFDVGEIGKHVYFILEGEIAIFLPNKQDYVIEKGEFTSFKDIQEKKYKDFRLIIILTQGSYFGEIALQNKVPRTGSAVAKTLVDVASLSYSTYQKIISLAQKQINEAKLNLLKKLSLYEGWEESQLQIILRHLEEKEYLPFTYIYKQGSKIDFIYFILNGEVKVQVNKFTQENDMIITKQKQVVYVSKLTENQHFGDVELFNNPELLEKGIDLNQKLQGYKRESEALTQSFCKIYRLNVFQFVENYHVFSNIEKAKQGYRKISNHRLSMQRLRDMIISNPSLIVEQIQSKRQQPIKSTSYQELNQNLNIPLHIKIRAGMVKQNPYRQNTTNSSSGPIKFFSPARLRSTFGYTSQSIQEKDITQINCKKIRLQFTPSKITRRQSTLTTTRGYSENTKRHPSFLQRR